MGRRGPAVTRRDGRADGVNDAQIVGRVGVDVCHLDRAVPVTCPKVSVGGHHHAVRSRAVRSGGAATGRRGRGESAGHAGDAAHEGVVLGIDDVHAGIRSVGDVVPLGSWIDPGNVGASDGVTGNSDHAAESDGRVRLALVALATSASTRAAARAPVERERRTRRRWLLRVTGDDESDDAHARKESRSRLHDDLLRRARGRPASAAPRYKGELLAGVTLDRGGVEPRRQSEEGVIPSGAIMQLDAGGRKASGCSYSRVGGVSRVATTGASGSGVKSSPGLMNRSSSNLYCFSYSCR